MKKFHYYTAASTRELDRLAIEKHNIPGFELMQLAGKAAFNALLKNWPKVNKIIVLCGSGNNGGDGFIIAGLAQSNNLQVDLFIAGEKSSIKGDAKKALDFALKRRVIIRTASEFSNSYQNFKIKNKSGQSKDGDTVIVDTLLGTGLSGDVREPYSSLINQINSSNLPVLAVDVPSGLCSDTGKILGSAVKANLTITFICRKIGLILGSGIELSGKLLFDDLNVPKAVYSKVPFSK